MTTYEGQLTATNLKLGIVVSRFNDLVTERLLAGALDAFRRHGGDANLVEVARVPGAFEMPLVAKTLAQSGRFAAVVCLGCVIKGATDHYDYVCSQAAAGVLRAGLDTGVPVIFGVLTTDNLDQALERAGSKAGNKGADAMLAAIEMASLMEQINSAE
ncbi:MAG TPA: 6,7-dimethyl-8-ribityllumazine synthase [Abditibacteriaceae bacterium]|nr:6,7-dimethyl-8-ribityllumazine synthase [Abditibacteriaceae bacterium]